MDFSIATLLANFQEDKLVAPKVLEKKLGCQDELDSSKLQVILDTLEKIGILVKERGKYRRVTEDNLVEAKLRCSSKGFCFAIQEVEGTEDIYIRESHLSNAWNGDRVLVKVTREGSRRRSPEGEVRLILERANPSILARVKETEAGYSAIPLDDRLLFELVLLANGINLQEAINCLVHVEVKRYPLGPYPPIGKVARILGTDAEAAADIDIVRCKHDLPQGFNPTVLHEASKIKAIEIESLEKHIDLRDLLTISFGISNEPHEIENALSLEYDSQQWRIGIHVTDVSRYIEPDTALDREARKRGTIIYLGEEVVHLYPQEILSICALTPLTDHICYSVFLSFDSEGKLIETEIQPSIIKVDYHLSYLDAEAIVNGNHNQNLPLEVQETVIKMAQLSQAILNVRQTKGGFMVLLRNPNYAFSDEGKVGAVPYISSHPYQTAIIEIMILANQCVANQINSLELPLIYRTHPAPDPDDVQELLKLGNNLGLPINLEDTDFVTPVDYQKFISAFADSPSKKVLNYLLHETFRTSLYSANPGFHFGLAWDTEKTNPPTPYTQFVCPLKRYGDLLVQRVLQAIVDNGRDRRSIRTKEVVNLLHNAASSKVQWNVLPTDIHQELEHQINTSIVHLNEREKVSVDAEADLEGLKKADLMKSRTGEVFQGIITGVQSYGFFVEIESLSVEGLVHVSSLKDDWYEYRSRYSCLVGRKTRVSYKLGDRVEVQVKSVDYYRQQIDLAIVGMGGDLVDPHDEMSNHPEFESEDISPYEI